MTPGRRESLATVALAALASGCGFGPGEDREGEASLRVTRDYGAQVIAGATEGDPSESDTVIRLLDRVAEIETRYGGGFVQSIDGLAGGIEAGRSFDWFFYVDGIESSVGSAEVPIEAGSRIWWDYHDWTDVMRVPAVVGSWPEPLAQSTAQDPEPVVLQCEAAPPICDAAGEQLADAGISAEQRDEPSRAPALRILVGDWGEIRGEPVADLLDSRPGASGVFATFERDGRSWSLQALDERARPVGALGPGAGLVAAVREGDDPPAWLVTGTDEEGTMAAVDSLEPNVLRDRFAVAVDGSGPLALPVVAK